ncbi:hypothetical protein AB4212_63540, partial [Streptomyces sp. 2MCAF27]
VCDTVRDITDGVVELEEAVHDRLGLPPAGNGSVEVRLGRLAGLLDRVETDDWLEYAITLAPDDELVVDTAEGTVMFNGTASRRHTAVPGSAPEESFTLPPGTSQLSFRAASGGAGATATIAWRRAEW